MNNVVPCHRPIALRWLRVLPLLALLAVAWLLPGRAHADNTCRISGITPIAFGTVDGSGGTTTSTFSIVCQNDGPAVRNFRVCLYMNPVSPSGLNPRRMEWFAPNFLNYQLYSDPGMTQVLGSTTSGDPVHSLTMTTTAIGQTFGTLQVHGRVLPGQPVPAGIYSGDVTDMVHTVTTADGSTLPDLAQCATPTSTAQTNSRVTASFADTCYISTATDLDFGSVADLVAASNQTSRISMRCPNRTRYNIKLNYGNHSTGTTNRRMLGPGGNYLTYQLYRNSGRTQIWGNTNSTDRNGTGNGGIQDHTVYGRVPAQPVGSAGSYSDTIIVTLTF